MKEKVFSPIEKILNACSKKLKLKEPSKIDHWISQLEADYNSLKISINDNTWQINYEDILINFLRKLKSIHQRQSIIFIIHKIIL